MLKASGGGGGMGQHVCWTEDDVPAAFAHVESRSKELFGDTGVFLEKYYPASHHIEVQVCLGVDNVTLSLDSDQIPGLWQWIRSDTLWRTRVQHTEATPKGTCLSFPPSSATCLCACQVIEECPSPYLVDKPEVRQRLVASALTLARTIKYRSVGTVEFLVDDETGDFFFLEMNTRLQVEHGITELCYDVDLVALMLRQAGYQFSGSPGIPSNELLKLQAKPLNGSAIESRVCCENPADSFMPGSGHVQSVAWPINHARVDTWIQPGTFVSPYFGR